MSDILPFDAARSPEVTSQTPTQRRVKFIRLHGIIKPYNRMNFL